MSFQLSLCVVVIACFVGACSHVRTYSQGPRAIYLYSGSRNNHSDITTTTLAYDEDDDGSGSNESDNYQYEPRCPPEPFRHYFIKGSGRGKKLFENEWKSARINELGSLRKLCLLPNGTSVIRRCILHYQSPVWEDISHWGTVECLGETRQPINSDDLNELHVELMKTPKHLDVANVTSRMNTIFSPRRRRVLPADVQLTGNIFKTLRDAPKSSDISKSILTACDSMMDSESHSAVVSAAKSGATNDMLQSFEQYMDDAVVALDSLNNCVAPTQHAAAVAATNSASVEDVDYSHLGIRAHLLNHISVFYVNPLCANVTGIAIYERTARSAPHDARHFHEHANYSYRFVRMDESLSVLMSEPGLQLATFIPTSLWQHLKAQFSSYYLHLKQPVVVLKVYSNDGLFVENSPLLKRKPHSKILSISIPDQYVGNLPENIPFLLRNEDFATNTMTATHVESFSSATSGCGYWNYSTWDDRGVETLNKTAEIIICGTKHLTQFSFLLGGSYRSSDVSDDVVITALSQRALDVISLIGCTLSLLGLLAIWLTALLFPKWRSQGPTKVLLNLCLALTLQMILFLVVQTEDVTDFLVSRSSYVPCLMLGALMQYSILVLFTWMLIIACLQFQRYVIVLGIQRPRHYILKSALIAWLLPLLPVVLVASIDPDSYRPPDSLLITNNAICYPNGAGLTFGVVVPVAIIVMANLFIFIYVSYSVATQLRQVEQRNERKMFMQQVRLSVMLFFLLGLSWIFGIFAFMQAGVVFSYLFCLTATMQGFVLFIYFVVMNAETRTYWKQLFTGKKAVDKSKSSELQSMSTSTTRTSSKKNHK